jgi:hypothetical protein
VHVSDSASFYSDKSNAVKYKYKPLFKGWKLAHDYKVNNAFGIPVVIKTTFYFNVPITKITRPEEIVEFARYKRKAYGNNLVWATFS